MRKKFRDLVARTMTPEQQAKMATEARELSAALTLAELRKARELSQQALAIKLNTSQSGISRLEHQTDMYLSTLRGYVEASGGHLELTVRYPDTEVRLTGLADLIAV